VLDVHRGNVDSWTATQPTLSEIQLLWSLKNYQVDILVTQLIDRNLLCAWPNAACQPTPV
jgi:hypothetical protein